MLVHLCRQVGFNEFICSFILSLFFTLFRSKSTRTCGITKQTNSGNKKKTKPFWRILLQSNITSFEYIFKQWKVVLMLRLTWKTISTPNHPNWTRHELECLYLMNAMERMRRNQKEKRKSNFLLMLADHFDEQPFIRRWWFALNERLSICIPIDLFYFVLYCFGLAVRLSLILLLFKTFSSG